MGWTQITNLKGPQGDPGAAGLAGPPGRGLSSAGLNANGQLVLTYSDGTQWLSDSIKGPPGADGRSVSIVAAVATAAQLPTDLGKADAGDGYLTQDDGHLHIWDGTVFTDVGNIRGPRGEKGNQGDQGPRGSVWFRGNGAPPDPVPDSRPGDFYLDLLTGTVYALS